MAARIWPNTQLTDIMLFSIKAGVYSWCYDAHEDEIGVQSQAVFIALQGIKFNTFRT